MATKALVLSSGGIDSSTCLGLAVKNFGKENVSSVSVTYGQRHTNELDYANKIAEFYDVKHYLLDLKCIFEYSDCSLMKFSSHDIDEDTYEHQYEVAKEEGGHIASYVPFRNGVMLSSVAALALSIYPDEEVEIYLGCHADDYAYADCTPEFIKHMTAAIDTGTYNKIKVKTPLYNLTKAEVVGMGLKLGVPYKYTWSCYNGGEKPCCKCASCLDRMKAFELNGMTDPLLGE